MLPDHEMSYQQLISTLSSPDIQRTLREYQISHLWLVGSWAENEQTTESDIDLVYDKS
jgi:predicted nucleotidyltransferase